MAKVLKSSHPTRRYSDGGVIKPPTKFEEHVAAPLKKAAGRAIDAVTQPTKASNAAGEQFNAELRAKRDAAQAAEGKRLESMTPAPKKQKPYTNPDGTPWTREQMRKHLGR